MPLVERIRKKVIDLALNLPERPPWTGSQAPNTKCSDDVHNTLSVVSPYKIISSHLQTTPQQRNYAPSKP
ncbi:hypothetical protein J6590_027269 [Homalodisca vitripennis]|nr:hypothetical protein J6590_027269 [Homalodisca vitripennis]